MAKKRTFSWNFDLFLTFFIDCGHIYAPNGRFWGSTSRLHIWDLVMNLFFTFGSTSLGWVCPKMDLFWPKKAKHGRLDPDSTKPNGNALIGHMLSTYMGKHVLGSFLSLATPKKWQKMEQTWTFFDKNSQAWQACFWFNQSKWKLCHVPYDI